MYLLIRNMVSISSSKFENLNIIFQLELQNLMTLPLQEESFMRKDLLYTKHTLYLKGFRIPAWTRSVVWRKGDTFRLGLLTSTGTHSTNFLVKIQLNIPDDSL